MRPIVWAKAGDVYYGAEPGEYVLGLGNTIEGKWFDPMLWRVDAGRHVSFQIPAEPPYFIPTLSPLMETFILTSLDEHKARIADAARDMAAEP